MREVIKARVADARQRAALYQNLSGINRVPFKQACSEFCNHLSISLDDLWPLERDERGIGLIDLRNRIVHGTPFPETFGRQLHTALGNLQWTLARMIVHRLGWAADDTAVFWRPADAQPFFPYARRDVHREQLTRFVDDAHG